MYGGKPSTLHQKNIKNKSNYAKIFYASRRQQIQ